MPTAESIRIASRYQSERGASALTESQAKLYSQSVRREMGREGLASFGLADIGRALEEAFLLIQYAFLLRTSESENTLWQDGVKRAAEILEWLSQADLRPPGAPVHLLSGAAYQLAGYPAMALGELKRLPSGDPASDILAAFLRADFPAGTRAMRTYWQRELSTGEPSPGADADFSAAAIQHVIRCIGTICEYLRFGSNDRVPRAVDKLEKLSSGFLHSRDSYSALLAKLTAAVARKYVRDSLWGAITRMQENVSRDTAEAFNQFARAQFQNRRALVWPAQAAGIERLRRGTSFALCTPTGSGKTTVATLAIIPALFEANPNLPEGLEELRDNLVLYIVPSRALAAEVEERLDQDLRGISARRVVVTGLYGGNDWGPTDAWISQDQPTILICTFEKADALLRYLGILFLSRVRLVIIDEAHSVNYGKPEPQALETASSRPFRLELLGTRLNIARQRYSFRTIALSAVAAAAAPSLARWISSDAAATPTESRHRSTRQLLGRLEVTPGGAFTIRYDLMNGQSLKFNEGRTTLSPYVAEPFLRMPQRLGPRSQPEIRMRAPTLWAALNLASERIEGTKPTVLISITQRIETFAKGCLDILAEWAPETLPRYFEPDQDNVLYADCLASMADYFSSNSFEYRLLQRGIAVHHGKMPTPVARRLKRLIDRSVVRVIIATSTLSEGVNIPVNYILLPSVFRGQTRFELQEFSNLIGRAGRPGVATEGHALMVLPEEQFYNRQSRGYQELRDELERATNANQTQGGSAQSALVALLATIESTWRQIAPRGTAAEFEQWLEQTAVATAEDSAAVRNLDSLDYFLLSALQEVEQVRDAQLNPIDIETELRRIWNATYAFASSMQEERLRDLWLRRGSAITTIYPDARDRTRIYKTSLTPRSAQVLLDRRVSIVDAIRQGTEYARWTLEQRLQFVFTIISLLNEIPAFRLDSRLGANQNFRDWPRLLRWWLCKQTLADQPTPTQVTVWFDYVSKNFTYRSSWGLGSVIALLLNETDGDPIRPLEIDDWPRAGLPWIAFWLKEMLTWGTLEPVASFLLARGYVKTRPEAEERALTYYGSRPHDTLADDLLDPRAIRDWAQQAPPRSNPRATGGAFEIAVTLARNAETYSYTHLHVSPIRIEDRLTWIDKAGYAVAYSAISEEFPGSPEDYEFQLDVSQQTVRGFPYLAYREN